MSIALITSNEKNAEWQTALERELGETVEIWPDVKQPNEIEIAIVSAPPKGILASLPNLKVVLSLWAGVEHITDDENYPRHIPIIRMVDSGLSEGMRDYVLGQVFFLHLNMAKYLSDQKEKQWKPKNPPLARQRKVGVLGLGQLGRFCAEALKDAGFQVAGWSRRPKDFEGITCYDGEAGLKALLSECEIIVNLLPNTPATTKLLNKETLNWLPKGAGIVNPGRGTLFDDHALVSALDQGQLSAAVLDVFWEEPLPDDHPFWAHENIFITPHIASVTRIDTGAETLKKTIDHIRDEKPVTVLEALVDISQGY